LKLDPKNEEAKNFLALVQQKKQEADRKAAQTVQKTTPAATTKRQTAALHSNPSIPPAINPPKIVPPPPPVASKTEGVNFEFEHSFPSGSLYIYLGDKLIYQGELTGTEKKVLMFHNYHGKLTGSLQLPAGDNKLRVHVVCKELHVSAYTESSKTVKEGQNYNLKIKYSKDSKTLEVRWS